MGLRVADVMTEDNRRRRLDGKWRARFTGSRRKVRGGLNEIIGVGSKCRCFSTSQT